MKNKQVRTRQFRGMFSVIDLGKDNQFCRNLICSKRIKVIETNLSWNIQLWKLGKKSELEIWEHGVKPGELSKGICVQKKSEWWTET